MKKWFADRYEELNKISMLQNSKNVPCAMWEKAGQKTCTLMVTLKDGVAFEQNEEWGFAQILKRLHEYRINASGNIAHNVMTFSTRECISYVVLVPISELSAGFNLLKKTLEEKTIEWVEVEAHRHYLCEALIKEQTNPWRNNQVVLESLLLSPHPMSRRQLSLSDFDFDKVTSQIRTYKDRVYCLENMMLTLVGSFDHKAISEEVELFLGGFRTGRKRTSLNALDLETHCGHKGKLLILDYPEARQTNLSVGWRLPQMDERTYIAWQLLNNMIGAGISSDLFQKVATEHGLTGVAQSKLRVYSSLGTWRMQMNVFDKNLPSALEQLKNQLLSIGRRGIQPERLRQIKKVCWTSMLADLEDPLCAAQWINQHLRLFGDVCFMADYGQHLASLMEEELLSLIERDLDWENKTTCLSGKTESIQGYIDPMGIVQLKENEFNQFYKSS